MRWIELHNLEYGECVVLGGRQSILMVDCGSMNVKRRDSGRLLDDCYAQIATRYEAFLSRDFLLTHYHKDHYHGFDKIIRMHPGYFNRVYLPFLPQDHSRQPIYLDFAIFAHLFSPHQSDCAQYNTACVKAFKKLSTHLGIDRLFLLRAGDQFTFDQVDYDVLWPPETGFEYDPTLVHGVDQLNLLFASPFRPEFERRFFQVKNALLSAYQQCCQAFSARKRTAPALRHEAMALYLSLLAELEALKPQLLLSPQAHDVLAILNDPATAQAFSDAANAMSVVFQNRRTGAPGLQDILMTGDAPPQVLTDLQDVLYDGYYVLKAPHHGTASGYAPLFEGMSFSHVLISNGHYQNGGAIAEAYAQQDIALCHCTNATPCKWLSLSDCCCNRLRHCYDVPPGGALTLKCRAANGKSPTPPCMIRIVDFDRESGCFCDG